MKLVQLSKEYWHAVDDIQAIKANEDGLFVWRVTTFQPMVFEPDKLIDASPYNAAQRIVKTVNGDD